jgi:hypothetical protein
LWYRSRWLYQVMNTVLVLVYYKTNHYLKAVSQQQEIAMSIMYACSQYYGINVSTIQVMYRGGVDIHKGWPRRFSCSHPSCFKHIQHSAIKGKWTNNSSIMIVTYINLCDWAYHIKRFKPAYDWSQNSQFWFNGAWLSKDVAVVPQDNHLPEIK